MKTRTLTGSACLYLVVEGVPPGSAATSFFFSSDHPSASHPPSFVGLSVDGTPLLNQALVAKGLPFQEVGYSSDPAAKQAQYTRDTGLV